MRIADKMSLQQVQNSLSKNRSDMSHLQEQSSTQRKINKPSDDPLGATRVLNAKTEEKTQKQFIKSLQFATDFLNFTDQSLGEVGEIIGRAKELAINQANEASANRNTRQVVATEMEQLLNQTVQVANRKLGDRYIFAGFRTNQVPFTKQGEYKGDDGEIKIQVNKDSYVTMNLPGNKIFLGEGNGSNDLDALDVPRNSDQLQQLKQFEQQEEERKSEQIPLAQVYSKNTQSRSLASVGGPVESDGASDYAASNGANIFDVLQSLVISLKTDNRVGIQESLDQLDLAFAQVTTARSQVGSRVMALSNTFEALQKGVVDSKSTASQLEDADVLQLVSDINRADTALKATLETSGRLIQPSLLDFIK
jgi:flagellar hook-associated protein 3 FlgL